MPSFRLHELKDQQRFQQQVFNQISEFIKIANKYVYGKEHLSVDFMQNAETQKQLDFLLGEIQIFKERMIKASRNMKPRTELERQSFRGPISAMVGNRRIMIKKLGRLAEQIRWLKRQVNVFTPKGRNAAVERTMTLVQESITIESGKPTMLPGQGIVIAIAMLGTVFVEIKMRRSKSKITADVE